MIIMDEPTTALDIVVQREILQKIYALKEEFGFSILFITPDLTLMVEFSDRIGIMYSGELNEVDPSKQILKPLPPLYQRVEKFFSTINWTKTKLTGILETHSTCWTFLKVAVSKLAVTEFMKLVLRYRPYCAKSSMAAFLTAISIRNRTPL